MGVYRRGLIFNAESRLAPAAHPTALADQPPDQTCDVTRQPVADGAHDVRCQRGQVEHPTDVAKSISERIRKTVQKFREVRTSLSHSEQVLINSGEQLVMFQHASLYSIQPLIRQRLSFFLI